LIVKTKANKPLERPRCRWEHVIKADLKKYISLVPQTNKNQEGLLFRYFNIPCVHFVEFLGRVAVLSQGFRLTTIIQTQKICIYSYITFASKPQFQRFRRKRGESAWLGHRFQSVQGR
jgi:hypothetical protein